MGKNNIYQIASLSCNASNWDLKPEEFEIILSQVAVGLVTHGIVGLYSSENFRVSIFSDEDFRVVIEMENGCQKEVTPYYLEEVKKLMRLKNAAQILIDEIKPYL